MLEARALCSGDTVSSLSLVLIQHVPHIDPASGNLQRSFRAAVLSNPHNSEVSPVVPISQTKRLRFKDLPKGMELTHGGVGT